jgi:phosphate:Na+ symporter
MLNILGVLVFLPFTNTLTNCTAALSTDFAGQIALMHTIFNILCSLLLMPFYKTVRKINHSACT